MTNQVANTLVLTSIKEIQPKVPCSSVFAVIHHEAHVTKFGHGSLSQKLRTRKLLRILQYMVILERDQDQLCLLLRVLNDETGLLPVSEHRLEWVED